MIMENQKEKVNTKAFEKQYVYFLMLFIVGASPGGLLTKDIRRFVGTAIGESRHYNCGQSCA